MPTTLGARKPVPDTEVVSGSVTSSSANLHSCSETLHSLATAAICYPAECGLASPLLPDQRVHIPVTGLGVFAVNIRNRSTRLVYLQAVPQIGRCCEGQGIRDLTTFRPPHVAAYIVQRLLTASKPPFKQRLAALRALIDWMVVGQVIEMNPAASVRGPK